MQQDMAGAGIPGSEATRAEEVTGKPGDAARKTLATRIAHRNRLRAERLARLHAAPGAPAAPKAAEARSEAPPSPAAPKASDAAPSRMPVPKPAARRVSPAADPALEAAREAEDNAAALEDFLKALSQGSGPLARLPAVEGAAEPPASPDPEPASVLPFQRPTEAETAFASERGPDRAGARHSEPRAAPVCDLHRLEGAGPGLIWALQRSGIACLAELAPLEAPELVSRLGYLGRLVPAETWISAARMQ